MKTIVLCLLFLTSVGAKAVEELVSYPDHFADGFLPIEEMLKISPESMRMYDHIMAGEVLPYSELPLFLRLSIPGHLKKSHVRFRVVTLYNVERVEAKANFSYQLYEECHDAGMIGTFNESFSYTVSVSSRLGMELLGLDLGADIRVGKTKTVSVSRHINGEKNVEAVHEPYFNSQDWSGVSYVQYYNKRSKELGHLRAEFPFQLENVAKTLRVKRKLIGECDAGA